MHTPSVFFYSSLIVENYIVQSSFFPIINWEKKSLYKNVLIKYYISLYYGSSGGERMKTEQEREGKREKMRSQLHKLT